MELFKFRLKPLEEVHPWAKEGDLHLNWFSLTDGTFQMSVGEEQLFQTRDETYDIFTLDGTTMQEWNKYHGYLVAWPHQDLLSILPDVLQAVPEALHERVATPENLVNWYKMLNKVAEEDEFFEKYIDLHEDASDWWYWRQISTRHLTHLPDIRIWAHADRVHILWNNYHTKPEEAQGWIAMEGTFDMPRSEFMSEVESFHNQLMDAMEERIHTLKTANPLPHLRIDIEQMVEVQEEMKGSLEAALVQKPKVEKLANAVEANQELFG